MKLKSTIILRKIAGETILVPVGEDAVRVNGLITVNEVGALICEQLKEERTVDALVAAVTAQFDVDAQTARADIASFIHTLEENDFIGITDRGHIILDVPSVVMEFFSMPSTTISMALVTKFIFFSAEYRAAV